MDQVTGEQTHHVGLENLQNLLLHLRACCKFGTLEKNSFVFYVTIVFFKIAWFMSQKVI